MEKSDFTSAQIREFMKVDKRFMDNWKQSVIQSRVINVPRTFSFVMDFTNWKEAMNQLDKIYKEK